jgi:hypothetical protein
LPSVKSPSPHFHFLSSNSATSSSTAASANWAMLPHLYATARCSWAAGQLHCDSMLSTITPGTESIGDGPSGGLDTGGYEGISVGVSLNVWWMCDVRRGHLLRSVRCMADANSCIWDERTARKVRDRQKKG